MGILVEIEEEPGSFLHIEKPHLAVATRRNLTSLATDPTFPLPRLVFTPDLNVYYIKADGTVYIRTDCRGPELPDWVFKRLHTVEWVFE